MIYLNKTIGLNVDEVLDILSECKVDQGLAEAIAQIIVKNNEKIKEEINKPRPAIFG